MYGNSLGEKIGIESSSIKKAIKDGRPVP